jgi:hypothetical protein
VPTLVFIIGPPAVGKMTVGQALARRTGFRLFHLHQVIDLVTEYFAFDSPAYLRLVPLFRTQIFEEAARSGLDLITTGSWQFEDPDHTAIFRRFVQPYVECGGRVCFVELLAPLEVRLARNLTENRRRHKKTDWSTDEALRRDAAAYRYDSGGALPLDLPLLRLETARLTAEATAERIREFYGLP